MELPSAPPEKPASSSLPARVLALVFLAIVGYSVYFVAKLLASRCEGFSCTYLGIAWLFWLGMLCLPATALGYFAQRAKSLAAQSRFALRLTWLAHCLLALGLAMWWLVHRS
jgi:hypothetical protein